MHATVNWVPEVTMIAIAIVLCWTAISIGIVSLVNSIAMQTPFMYNIHCQSNYHLPQIFVINSFTKEGYIFTMMIKIFH